MDYKIVEKEAFKVVVKAKRFKDTAEERPSDKIPDFRKDFFAQGLDKKLTADWAYTSSFDEKTQTFKYGIGCPQDMVKKMQDDFEIWDIPASKWIVFKLVGDPATEIPKMWEHIFIKGLPTPEYETINSIDMEYLGDQDYCELWVSVREKLK